MIAAGSFSHAQIKWNEYKSDHFVVYYREAPVDFVQSVQDMAEGYYKEISENLGFTRYQNWTYDDRAKIYIYNDYDDYIATAKQAKWSHGVASARSKEIRTFPAAHGFFDSTLPHELGHIIFREFIGIDTPTPLWLDEGVAMYQEKAKRWGSNAAVKKAIEQKTFMPLDDLSTMYLYNTTPKDIIDLYYAEAASIVYFLITEWGSYRFVNFCRRLSDHYSFKDALTATYPRIRNISDLNKAWVSYLNQ